jgi:ADP-ribosyl-[dinitrogen reductase] hydrolase
LRCWLLTLPAGIGLATMRSLVRLWLGFGYRRSGVKSAGNGPAMRAPILGLWFARNDDRLTEYVDLSSRISHTDSRAIDGARITARVVSHGVRLGVSSDTMRCAEECIRDTSSTDLTDLVKIAAALAERGATPTEDAFELGVEKGVIGFMNHTVPAVLYCWWSHRALPREGIAAIIGMGGDADTTAAILGGMYGAVLGRAALPVDWLEKVSDWPRSRSWIENVGRRLAAAQDDDAANPGTAPLFWPGYVLRSPVFIAVVLIHGFRRLLPPY